MELESFPSEMDEKTLDRIHGALAHSFRRDLLRFIGDMGWVPFKDLQATMQAGPGTLYYHLKKCRGLITQDLEKRYILTPEGERARAYLDRDSNFTFSGIPPSAETLLNRLFRFVLPIQVFRQIIVSPRTIVESAGILLMLTLLAIQAEMGVIPLFFDPELYFGALFVPIQVILSAIILWVALEITIFVATAVEKINPSPELFLGVPFALLPLGVLPLLYVVLDMASMTDLLSEPVMLLLQLFLQIWTIGLLTRIVQVTKSLPMEKALVPVLLSCYLFASIAFLFPVGF
ncbi:MAG: winged helix-turn-helix domain-containing protein [Candidatus Hodarchaeales archaeon]